MYALAHGRIYTGHDILDGYAVVVDDGLIQQVCPIDTLPAGIETIDLQGATLSQGLLTFSSTAAAVCSLMTRWKISLRKR